MDWALQKLGIYTFELGDKFQLASFPGLGEVLVEYVRRYSMALAGLPRSEWDAMQYGRHLNGSWIDQGIGKGDDGSRGIVRASVAMRPFETLRPPASASFDPKIYHQDAALARRASDAGLILRNLAMTMQNVAQIAQVPRLLELLCQVLSLEDMDDHAELRLYMLDVLECLAPHIILSDWVRQTFVQTPPSPSPPRFLEDRIFAILYDWAQNSEDRALMLGSLRCLRALASNTANASSLAEVDASLQPTSLRLMARCVSLLPLTHDPELLEAALDLLYQLTIVGHNALRFGLASGLREGAAAKLVDMTRPDAVFAFLARNLALGKSVWERDTTLTPNSAAWWANDVVSVARVKQRRILERRERMTPAERQRWKVLTPEARARIDPLPEPQRGIEWMQTLFEVDPQGEVTQMEFWITYRDQFTPLANAGGNPLQPAANLIRNVSQAFPGAAAMVIQGVNGAQPRFVIRGISPRVRDTANPSCSWAGCPTPTLPTWSAVRDHLLAHVSLAEDGLCRCTGCTYIALSEDTSKRADALRMHVLTHLPPTPAPRNALVPSATSRSGTQDDPGMITFDVERTPSVPTNVAGEPPMPCGVAFLSLLTLRYVTRTASAILARGGFGCPASTYGGAVEPQRTPAEREELFGFPMAALADGGNAPPPDGASDHELRFAQAAVRIMRGVSTLEDVLMETSLRNDILCRLANDTLVAIRPVLDDDM